VAEEGKERTKQERLGSICGVGVSVWVPQQPLSIPTLPRIPQRRRFAAAAAAAAATISHTYSVAVVYGVRDGRGSILRWVEGVHERLWHAHTPRQAGMDLRTRTPYANLFSDRSVNDSVDILLLELRYINKYAIKL